MGRESSDSFPVEVLKRVLPYLSCKEVARLCLVSRKWKKVCGRHLRRMKRRHIDRVGERPTSGGSVALQSSHWHTHETRHICYYLQAMASRMGRVEHPTPGFLIHQAEKILKAIDSSAFSEFPTDCVYDKLRFFYASCMPALQNLDLQTRKRTRYSAVEEKRNNVTQSETNLSRPQTGQPLKGNAKENAEHDAVGERDLRRHKCSDVSTECKTSETRMRRVSATRIPSEHREPFGKPNKESPAKQELTVILEPASEQKRLARNEPSTQREMQTKREPAAEGEPSVEGQPSVGQKSTEGRVSEEGKLSIGEMPAKGKPSGGCKPPARGKLSAEGKPPAYGKPPTKEESSTQGISTAEGKAQVKGGLSATRETPPIRGPSAEEEHAAGATEEGAPGVRRGGVARVEDDRMGACLEELQRRVHKYRNCVRSSEQQLQDYVDCEPLLLRELQRQVVQTERWRRSSQRSASAASPVPAPVPAPAPAAGDASQRAQHSSAPALAPVPTPTHAGDAPEAALDNALRDARAKTGLGQRSVSTRGPRVARAVRVLMAKLAACTARLEEAQRHAQEVRREGAALREQLAERAAEAANWRALYRGRASRGSDRSAGSKTLRAEVRARASEGSRRSLERRCAQLAKELAHCRSQLRRRCNTPTDANAGARRPRRRDDDDDDGGDAQTMMDWSTGAKVNRERKAMREEQRGRSPPSSTLTRATSVVPANHRPKKLVPAAIFFTHKGEGGAAFVASAASAPPRGRRRRRAKTKSRERSATSSAGRLLFKNEGAAADGGRKRLKKKKNKKKRRRMSRSRSLGELSIPPIASLWQELADDDACVSNCSGRSLRKRKPKKKRADHSTSPSESMSPPPTTSKGRDRCDIVVIELKKRERALKSATSRDSSDASPPQQPQRIKKQQEQQQQQQEQQQQQQLFDAVGRTASETSEDARVSLPCELKECRDVVKAQRNSESRNQRAACNTSGYPDAPMRLDCNGSAENPHARKKRSCTSETSLAETSIFYSYDDPRGSNDERSSVATDLGSDIKVYFTKQDTVPRHMQEPKGSSADLEHEQPRRRIERVSLDTFQQTEVATDLGRSDIKVYLTKQDTVPHNMQEPKGSSAVLEHEQSRRRIERVSLDTSQQTEVATDLGRSDIKVYFTKQDTVPHNMQEPKDSSAILEHEQPRRIERVSLDTAQQTEASFLSSFKGSKDTFGASDKKTDQMAKRKAKEREAPQRRGRMLSKVEVVAPKRKDARPKKSPGAETASGGGKKGEEQQKKNNNKTKTPKGKAAGGPETLLPVRADNPQRFQRHGRGQRWPQGRLEEKRPTKQEANERAVDEVQQQEEQLQVPVWRLGSAEAVAAASCWTGSAQSLGALAQWLRERTAQQWAQQLQGPAAPGPRTGEGRSSSCPDFTPSPDAWLLEKQLVQTQRFDGVGYWSPVFSPSERGLFQPLGCCASASPPPFQLRCYTRQ